MIRPDEIPCILGVKDKPVADMWEAFSRMVSVYYKVVKDDEWMSLEGVLLLPWEIISTERNEGSGIREGTLELKTTWLEKRQSKCRCKWQTFNHGMKKTSLIFARWNLFPLPDSAHKAVGAVLKNKWSMENVHWDSVFLTFCNDLWAQSPWISVAFPEKPRGLLWIITLGHSCSLSIFTKRFAFGLNRSDTFYRVRSTRRYNKVNIILSRMRFRDSFIRNRTWMKMALFKRHLLENMAIFGIYM